MQTNRFSRTAVGDPSVAHFAGGCRKKELKWALQGGDHRRHLEQPVRHFQHGFRVAAEAMQGVLLQIARAEGRRCEFRWELRSDAEDCMDELALRDRIALGDPSDLTFADSMHRLVALDGSTGTLRRSKAEARGNPLLYETMVLFDDVV